MKTAVLIGLLALLAAPLPSLAEIEVPSDGSDGDLILPDTGSAREVIIDLSLAPTAAWEAPQQAPLDPVVGGAGVYDPDKWAVVFKYNTVRIGRNVTVRFKNHGSRAPVVWLVKGDVEIAGAISLKGRSYSEAPEGAITAEPGPGGFRGSAWPHYHYAPRGATYSTLVTGYRRKNTSLVPLTGGLGQGWWGDRTSYAGAGAMLIASRSRVHLVGVIDATGGDLTAGGGSVRIVAEAIDGVTGGPGYGWIDTVGWRGQGSPPGDGQVRLEAHRFNGTLLSRPDSLVVPPANPPVIWPAPDAPRSRIVSVEGNDVRQDPRSHIVNHPEGPDARAQSPGESRVVIEMRNFAVSPESKVLLHVDSNQAPRKEVLATPVEGGTFELSLWEVRVALPLGFSTLIVHAVAP